MQLTQIHLKSFRNYSELHLNFATEGLTAFIGSNAQGKTNLLEAVACLAYGKSFRTNHGSEILSWGENSAGIQGVFKDKSGELDLEIQLQRRPFKKTFKKRGKTCTPKDFLGNFRVVLFTPDTLELIHGSPNLRRQLLDRLLIQLDRVYFDHWTSYHRLLKQRNSLLKRIQMGLSQAQELDPWDLLMGVLAEAIWERRTKVVQAFSQHLSEHYQTISEAEEALEFYYEPHHEHFMEALSQHRSIDLARGSTQLGPHRDDFRLLLKGHDLAETASRGECRSAILALKMAEIGFIKAETGTAPVLLLDDVFSELDEKRQTQLGALVSGHQTLLTTTSLSHVQNLGEITVFEVEAGSMKTLQS